MHAVHVLNGPALPKSFESQPQLTALFISENALKLTYSNVETHNSFGVTPPRKEEGREGGGEGREGREGRRGNWSPHFSNQSYAPGRLVAESKELRIFVAQFIKISKC